MDYTGGAVPKSSVSARSANYGWRYNSENNGPLENFYYKQLCPSDVKFAYLWSSLFISNQKINFMPAHITTSYCATDSLALLFQSDFDGLFPGSLLLNKMNEQAAEDGSGLGEHKPQLSPVQGHGALKKHICFKRLLTQLEVFWKICLRELSKHEAWQHPTSSFFHALVKDTAVLFVSVFSYITSNKKPL